MINDATHSSVVSSRIIRLIFGKDLDRAELFVNLLSCVFPQNLEPHGKRYPCMAVDLSALAETSNKVSRCAMIEPKIETHTPLRHIATVTRSGEMIALLFTPASHSLE